MSRKPDSYDVVVVGGGPAGLAAASVAAEAGRSVALLDNSPWLGGQIWRSDIPTLAADEQLESSGPRIDRARRNEQTIEIQDLSAIWVPVGMYRYRMYRPPNRMEARTLTLGRQMVKMTRAMASQPRSPKALLGHTPLA